MSEKTKKVQVVAELKGGTNTEKVVITNLSMIDCQIRLTFRLRPEQFVVIRLYDHQGEKGFSPYNPMKGTVDSFRQSKTDPKVFYAKVSFNDIPKPDQGVERILNPGKFAGLGKSKKIEAKKNSLRGVSVRCHMCLHDEIPFWMLQYRCMLTKANIFGVPSYYQALTGQDFCDYNLIRVAVCPKCYFATNDVNFFQRSKEGEGFTPPPFDKKMIAEFWKEGIEERRKLVAPHEEGFYGEERTLEQALLSYDLGVMTCDAIFKADEEKEEKRRNYTPSRNAVSYLMFKAELLMANNQAEKAEKVLDEVVARLEKIFIYLNDEPSIKAGFLMGMISLYQNDTPRVKKYLSFLRDYNRDGKVKQGSDEFKTLIIKETKMSDAYQDKEDYSKDNLKSFHM